MPRAKVYEADIDGLHQWIVAAPNQRAALDAFGVHQDLFAQGLAKATADEEAIEAASARPGEPLRRLKGSTSGFQPVANGGVAGWTKAADAVSKGRPKLKAPSRAQLDRAQAALSDLEGEAKSVRSQLAAERRALEAVQAQTSAALDERLAKAQATVEEARAAFRQAGGKP